MKIIALGHRKRVGKNQFGQYLIEAAKDLNYSVATTSFASPLKEVSYKAFGWAGMRDEQYYEEHPEEREKILPEVGKTPRQIMIDIGLKMREIYPEVWAKIALHHTDTLASSGVDLVVITDLRFPNEANLLRSRGATLIKIDRPSVPNSNDAADTALQDFNEWDIVIKNEGTLEDLASEAFDVVLCYMKGLK